MDIFSHENILLIDHLNRVKEIGLSVFNNKNDIFKQFNYDNLKIVLSNILYYHDFGKSTIYFQEYLKASISGNVYKGDYKLKNHSLISACYSSYKTYKQTNDLKLSSIVFCVISKHHSNLQNFEDIVTLSDSDILRKQFDNLNFESINEKKEYDFDEILKFVKRRLFFINDLNVDYYILLNFCFSVLTYSDKNEAIFHKAVKNNNLINDFQNKVDDYKTNKFGNLSNSELNIIRENIYKEVITNLDMNKNIFSINVPTGSGKTLTAINLALKMLNINNKLTKIIYSLPFISIIDQIDLILNDIVSENNYLTHHHLTESQININSEDYQGSDAQFLIENWEKPIILTTFWQIFHSVLSNGNSQLRKFHQFANSVIIFDEIQTMPFTYWILIKEILQTLVKNLNCKIILMTATMPMIFSEKNNEIFNLININNRNNYFKQFSRYSLNVINELNAVYIDELLQISLNKINEYDNKNFLFVFNTIKSSLEFYKLLNENLNTENIELIYLSTNIIPIERKNKIEQIKNSKNRKIIVSTQLIEAGVDIDLDIVFRDFAPFDSIIQTAGRCNRNNKNETGMVYLFKLKDINDKLYCSYIYESIQLQPTEKILSGKTTITESELLLIIDKYYNEIKNKLSTNKSKELLKDVNNLNYENIFNNFKLIDYIPNLLVFVENDEKATEVLLKFKNIFLINDKFKRKEEFLKIKKDFYNYCISIKVNEINLSAIQNFEETGFLKIITIDMINNYYNSQTGFNSDCFENFI